MEQSQFEQQALEHLDAVYRMAMQLARNPGDASDLVQETYLKALRAGARFEERGGGMRSWLFKILHNVFYTHAVRNRRQMALGEAFPEPIDDQPPPDAPLPAWRAADFQWDHVDERLKQAIESLKPEYRSVLMMWGVEGMKYREIADVQDVPIGTVMSRLHRARSILARKLAGFGEENASSSG